jgi:hypothetical protein
MTKREAVHLVSRLFALIQLVTAALEASYLPERLMSLHHYTNRIGNLGLPLPDSYLGSYYNITVALLIARIGGLLVLAVIFWNCGPWVERILLPERDEAHSPSDPA